MLNSVTHDALGPLVSLPNKSPICPTRSDFKSQLSAWFAMTANCRRPNTEICDLSANKKEFGVSILILSVTALHIHHHYKSQRGTKYFGE